MFQRDFGPMFLAERRSHRTGKVYADDADVEQVRAPVGSLAAMTTVCLQCHCHVCRVPLLHHAPSTRSHKRSEATGDATSALYRCMQGQRVGAKPARCPLSTTHSCHFLVHVQVKINAELENKAGAPPRWWNAVIPIGLVIIFVFLALILTGVDAVQADPSVPMNIQNVRSRLYLDTSNLSNVTCCA